MAINLSCDKVDRAISFLASRQYIALTPLNNRVKLDTIIKGVEISKIDLLKLNKRNTPAVTRVDEWTKDETGVQIRLLRTSIPNKPHFSSGISLI